MEPDITPDDVISLGEKLAGLELSAGESAVLGAALGMGAEGADVSGFALLPTGPAEFVPPLLRSIGPAIDRDHKGWIERMSGMNTDPFY